MNILTQTILSFLTYHKINQKMKHLFIFLTFFLISTFTLHSCQEDAIDKGPDTTKNNTLVPPSAYCQPIIDYVANTYPSTVTIDSVLQFVTAFPGTTAIEVFEVHLSIGVYVYFLVSDCSLLSIQCNCPTTYDPVCWNGQTYDNECLAQCNGAPVSEIVPGICTPCGCPLTNAPVCYNNQTYQNECLAICAGALNYQIFPGECNSSCITATIQSMFGGVNYHILSVTTNALYEYLVTIEFGPNKILNLKFDPNCGYMSNCGCPGIFTPVCGNGITNYLNECEAQCAGVAIANIVPGFCN